VFLFRCSSYVLLIHRLRILYRTFKALYKCCIIIITTSPGLLVNCRQVICVLECLWLVIVDMTSKLSEPPSSLAEMVG